MTIYNYTAIKDGTNEVVKGKVEANDLREARAAVRELGFTPTNIVEEKAVDKKLESDPEIDATVTEPKPSLPEADIDVEPIIEPSFIETDPEMHIEEPASGAKDEPFEFFVDFDEPDMAERRITDDDLYGYEDSEFEHNRLRAQLID